MKHYIRTSMLKIATSILLAVILLTSATGVVYAQDTNVSNLMELKQALIVNLENRETSFSIGYTGSTQELIDKIQTVIKEAYSSDDYLQWSWLNIKPKVTGTYGNAIVSFSVSYLTTKAQEEYIDQEVQAVISKIITSDMANQAKIETIHNFILERITYDNAKVNRSAYTALHEGSAVCQGYALLMDKMLEAVGIQSKIVTGYIPSGYHAWNLVNLDGNWYHIDSTNNDDNYNTKRFFMVTDSVLIANEFTWEKGEFPSANTEYISNSVERTPIVYTLTKTDLQNISKAKTYINNGLKLNSISYLDKSQTYADKVPNCVEKTELNQSIISAREAITIALEQKNIDKAVSYIVKLELRKTKTNLTYAEKYVAVLKEGDVKTGLLMRIDNVKISMGLMTAPVETVPGTTPTVDESSIISVTTPSKDVENVNEAVKNTVQAIDIATKAVTSAEKYKRTTYVNTAQAKVDILYDSQEKIDLQRRLNVVNELIEQVAISDATKSVVSAEKYVSITYVKSAQAKIDLLNDATAKVDLQARLNAVSLQIEQLAIIKATKAVESAEKYKRITYIKSAQITVSALADSEAKTALQLRLDALK